MEPSTIALVMDADYGARMRVLAETSYVWAVWSPQNEAAARTLWTPEAIQQMRVTLGSRELPERSASELFETMVDMAIEHHGALPRFIVVGTFQPFMQMTLVERGYSLFHSTKELAEFRQAL